MLFIVTSPLFHDLLPVISSPSYYLLPVTYHLLPIACYLLPITYYLLHLSRLIRVLTLYHKYDKLPISLVVHGRGKSCLRSWQMLLTDVIKSCHGREQVKMPVA